MAADFLEFLLRGSFSEKFSIAAVWTNAPKSVGRGSLGKGASGRSSGIGERISGGVASSKKKAVSSLASSRVSQTAKKYNLPCCEVEKITKADEELLKNIDPDFIFIIAFGKILPNSFYSLAKSGAYNLHFSLLPKYRGASPLQSAILHGDHETGITFQKINDKMDAGDIVLQKKFSLQNLSYPEALEKALNISQGCFPEFLEKVSHTSHAQGFQVQDHGSATFCSKIKKVDGDIKKGSSIKSIIAKYLAFQPWPGIYFIYKNQRYNLIKISASTDFSATDPLTSPTLSLQVLSKKLMMTAEDGAVEIVSIQRQGKKALPAQDFLNGCNWELPIYL